MSRYFAHSTAAGAVRYRQLPESIGVLEAPDQPIRDETPHAPNIDR